MKIAVQLLTWNGEAFLSDCLSSLASQSFKDWQIFVIDNHSTDNTVTIVNSWLNTGHESVKILPKNVGFAQGHNLLLRSHDAPYVFILNQDVFLEPDYLYELVHCLELHQEVSSATGRLLYWGWQNDKLIKTDIMDSAGLKIYRTHRVVERGRGEKVWSSTGVEKIFGVPATAALYRRAALDEAALNTINGREWFDSDFGSYKEDIDLAYRLQLLGWRSLYAPSARGYHHRGLRGAADATTAFFTLATWRQRRYKSAGANQLSYRNHLCFLFKTFAFPVFSLTWWATVLYEFTKAANLIFVEPKTFWHAWSELIRMGGSLRTKRRMILTKPHLPKNIKRFF